MGELVVPMQDAVLFFTASTAWRARQSALPCIDNPGRCSTAPKMQRIQSKVLCPLSTGSHKISILDTFMALRMELQRDFHLFNSEGARKGARGRFSMLPGVISATDAPELS